MKHERCGHIYDGGTGMDSPAGTQHLDGEIRADLDTSDALSQEDFFWDSPRGSEMVGGYSADTPIIIWQEFPQFSGY